MSYFIMQISAMDADSQAGRGRFDPRLPLFPVNNLEFMTKVLKCAASQAVLELPETVEVGLARAFVIKAGAQERSDYYWRSTANR